jgi:1-phosphatidylinositol-4-phosphate 5-kinase
MIVDIITGLEVTVKSRNYADEDKMLIPKDYKYWYQFKLKRAGRNLLKFKDFAPKVFYQMRQGWGVSEDDYLKSFEFDNLKAVRGEGKSGAFFIFTKDRQFVLKTATGEERDFLWQILPYYYQYMRRNPNSLLPRFYGVYSMKHEGIGGMIRFVVMNNIFNTPYSPVEKYDLKGSTVGRYVKETKRQPGVILKDLDIVGMGRKLHLPPNLHEELVRQLKKDSDFLATHKVMDYSLLLGIYYETEDNKLKVSQDVKALNENDNVIKTWIKNDFQKHYNGIKTVRPDGVTEVYYMGVIDILIQFEVKKKLEHLVKSIAYSSEEVSVVEPQFYSKRFFEFIISLFASEDNDVDDESSSESDGAGSSSSREVIKPVTMRKKPSKSPIVDLIDEKK